MKSLSAYLPEILKSPIREFLAKRRLWISQAGQDFWVAGEAFNGKRGGYFLDIGAHDGMNISNTYLLEKRLGWKGICIEANPNSFAALVKKRNSKCLNICLDSINGEIDFALAGVTSGIVGNDTDNSDSTSFPIVRMQTRVLGDVLAECNASTVIDYLSLDVEGAEERVLSGLDWSKTRFNCITIERPSERLRSILANEGYVLIKEQPGLDAFYVHKLFLPNYQQNLFSFWSKRVLLLIRWNFKAPDFSYSKNKKALMNCFIRA